MKQPQNAALLRSLKFTPLAILGLFLFSNFSGVLLSHVLAPIASAKAADVIPADIPTSGDHNLDEVIFRVAEQEGVDPRFIHAVIWQESRYDPTARSQAGAQGLMQLMPATAKRFGCKDVNDPTDNITAGTKYLSWLLKRFSGDVALTLAGYNAGEGAVDKYNGIPPFDETRNYVKVISARYGKTYHPVLSPEAAIQAFGLQPTQE
jgi:soluble lytic murein transglycosylase-like protein